ncbi:putative cysteine-rich receptor-like protein kinase 31 [Hordeum vulgare subsp. vulgare]|uniref:putative cysteine-rich receptor-like protein kinase 31 n=1 Tax=Hordeum vulgare subsp. vulgare TaxID=112509 RepID=UPI001D1A4DD9|nr:putative cysteine-rich receptor-like protein kinase 31 [Hordeum vulgare subsp. vulgare]
MDLQPNRSFTKNDLESVLLDEAAEPMALPFSLLENITNNFSYKQEIGRGGFAVVYMGMLENRAVAVKRLSHTYKYESEFLREVECLMKVKHKNVVRFLGYCSDTQGHVGSYDGKFVMVDMQERLLCFEYLPKGSLDNFIKDPSGGLDWKTRYQIIKGICEGLHYLHRINIMHLDLKPSNILMDDDMIPKITDFGLSRSLEEMQTRVLATKMFGTMGYLAPEFTSNVITHKFDLYSLGIIIMEILTGAKEHPVVENVLKSWDNWPELSQGNPHYEQIRVCAEIGIECINFDPTMRPDCMSHIMDRLAETERTKLKEI